MTLIQWYKNLALVGAILWFGVGLITIGGIVLSSLGWIINLVMGLIFISIGWLLYRRASSFYLFFSASPVTNQNNLHLQRFMRLDLLVVCGASLLGGILLIASISRVFGEGYAVFG